MPDNVDTAKAIYEAFGKGDMEGLKEPRFADGKLARAEFYTDSARAKAALG